MWKTHVRNCKYPKIWTNENNNFLGQMKIIADVDLCTKTKFSHPYVWICIDINVRSLATQILPRYSFSGVVSNLVDSSFITKRALNLK